MQAIHGLRRITVEAIEAVTPAAIQTAAHDRRVMKIVMGVTLFLTGVYFVSARGWNKSVPVQTGTTHRTKNDRSVTALIGVTILIFGACSFLSGLYELGGDGSDGNSASLSCEERIKRVANHLILCPEAKEVWLEAERKGPVKLSCYTADKHPEWRQIPEAYTDMNTGQIFLLKQGEVFSTNQPPPLLFELLNLQSRHKIKLCDYRSADALAYQVESMEYQNLLKESKIVDRCIDRGVWPVGWRVYTDRFKIKSERYDFGFLGNALSAFFEEDFSTFEAYLKEQDKTGHSDNLRLQWRQACGNTQKKS